MHEPAAVAADEALEMQTSSSTHELLRCPTKEQDRCGLAITRAVPFHCGCLLPSDWKCLMAAIRIQKGIVLEA
jgi:hypothetical protein